MTQVLNIILIYGLTAFFLDSMAATIQVDCGRYNDKGIVIYINDDKIGPCPIGAVVNEQKIVVSTNMTLNDGRKLKGSKNIELAVNAIKKIVLPIQLIETVEYKINKSSDVSELLVSYRKINNSKLKELILSKVRSIISNIIVELNTSTGQLNSLKLSEWKRSVVPQMYRLLSTLNHFYEFNILTSQIEINKKRELFWIMEKKKSEKMEEMMSDPKSSTINELAFLNTLISTIGLTAIIKPNQ